MIRLSIEAETLDLFLRDAVELSACLNEAFARMPVAETPKKPESPQEAKKPVEAPKAPDAPKASDAPKAPDAPKALDVPTAAPAPKTETGYKPDEVRAALLKIVKTPSLGKAKMLEVVRDFGVNKFQDIPEDQYPEVMRRVNEMLEGANAT
jgi:hypothetical protein